MTDQGQVVANGAVQEVDWLDWLTTRLFIIDMEGHFVPLHLNPNQLRLFGQIERQRSAGVPVRIIILKGRKSGMSTAVGARFYTEVQNRPNRAAFVCAHDADSSGILFKMVKIYDENMPAGERKAQQYSTKTEITWAGPHYSSYRVQTAGKLQLQRGNTLFYVHISELAFYPDAATTLTALFEAMAKTDDTMVIIESTANGVGGEFYERWQRAVERLQRDPSDLNGFMPIFISWLDDAKNKMRVPEGYDWSNVVPEVGEAEEELRAMCKELRYNKKETDQALYFRRFKINEDMKGDVNRFRQEYPSTPEEAFLVSGRPAIPRSIIKHHESLVKDGQRAKLYLDERLTTLATECTYDDKLANNYWEVWEPPQPGLDYVVFGDVSEGRLSDPNNTRSQPDRHAGGVLERTDMKLVAVFVSPRRYGGMPLDPDLFGLELLKAAVWFNMAWVSPEMNSCGVAALTALREYPKLFLRERPGDFIGSPPLSHYGWRTDGANRDLMIDAAIAACRRDPTTGFDEKVVHWCGDLVSEEKTFVIDNNGKRQHRPGAHDDLWMMLCGLIQLHQRCPRARTGTFGKWHGQSKSRKPLGVEYAGGMDPGVGHLTPRRAMVTR